MPYTVGLMPKRPAMRENSCPVSVRLAVGVVICLTLAGPLSAGNLLVGTPTPGSGTPHQSHAQHLRVLLTRAGQAARGMVDPVNRRLQLARQVCVHGELSQAATRHMRMVLAHGARHSCQPALDRLLQQQLNLPPPIA